VRAHTGSSLPGEVPGEREREKRNESQINKQTSRTNTIQATLNIVQPRRTFPQ